MFPFTDTLSAEIHNLLSRKGYRISGRNYVYYCVFHDDTRNPNLHVDYVKSVFHCFACGAGGSLKSLGEFLGLHDEDISQGGNSAKELWFSAEEIPYDLFLRIAKERCLSEETLGRVEIRLPPKDSESFQGYALFPIKTVNRQLVNVVGYLLNKEKNKPKYKQMQGVRSYPFGVESINFFERNMLFVVEGLFDALSSWEWEYPAIATLGLARQQIFSQIPLLPFKGSLVLAPDFDTSGQDALRKWIAYALSAGVPNLQVLVPTVTPLPGNAKDFNDILKLGKSIFELLEREILEIKPAPLYLIEETKRRGENITQILFFLVYSIGTNIADYLLQMDNEVRNLVLSLLEKHRAEETLGKVGDNQDALTEISRRDYSVLVLAATSLAGRAIISNYFLPTEIERLFPHIPIITTSSVYLPLFDERDIRQAARRLNFIYRKLKGNSLLTLSKYLRSLSVHSALESTHEGKETLEAL